MKKLTALLLLLPAIPLAVAEDDETPNSYLCIADMSTGFKYDNGMWQQTHFNVDGSKYMLRHTKESDVVWVKEHKWAWVEFGETVAYSWCDVPADSDYFNCSGVMVEVQLNVKTLRYQMYYHGTYLAASEEQHADTPHIEIGKCSPL